MIARAEVVTPFSQLSEADAELGQAELRKHVGAAAAGEVAWMRRLGRRGDGAWMLSIRTVRPAMHPDYRDQIFNASGPQVQTHYHPIEEAARLIQQGAEAEADRLAKRIADARAERAKAQADEEEQERRDRERQQVMEREQREKREKFHYQRWIATPAWAQAFCWHAIALEEEAPSAAQKLRELARGGIGMANARTEPGGNLPFPERRWEP
jgi:hypothetical protein